MIFVLGDVCDFCRSSAFSNRILVIKKPLNTKKITTPKCPKKENGLMGINQ
jgi:hypothetical protein